MSRVYRHPPPSTTRRPPLAGATPPRLLPPRSTMNQPVTRGAPTSFRGRTMHTERPQLPRNNNNLLDENDETQQQQEQRPVHVGDGFHMFTPSTTKREQMRRQAENEQRRYEAHLESKRLHGIHEVHRLGGDGISEEEVRQRQAEKFRREKLQRLEKSHQDQIQQKQQEEKDIETMENEKKVRTDQIRDSDRRVTMDRLTHQYDDMNISSDTNQTRSHSETLKSEKLSTLREMLPHIDDQTLQYHLEIYNGNIDAIVSELVAN
ncbi:unnamed protein product [Rotaria magnacalcarata]|uniref:CUE domain-containing protein n=1 Tax=Rotaria magnacalcarata TaxID=392030 RepID=A0A818X688_9BILA|nr:unnamed protein product [Rotaria magnacalcarata]